MRKITSLDITHMTMGNGCSGDMPKKDGCTGMPEKKDACNGMPPKKEGDGCEGGKCTGDKQM